jgi:hypothetical protein
MSFSEAVSSLRSRARRQQQVDRRRNRKQCRGSALAHLAHRPTINEITSSIKNVGLICAFAVRDVEKQQAKSPRMGHLEAPRP